MRKELLAGAGLVLIGVGVATPAAAENWVACAAATCLKSYCGDNDASVTVSMATDVDDPTVGGIQGIKNALLQALLRRGQSNGEGQMMTCSATQPDKGSAEQVSQNIYAQMRTSFSDVSLLSPNDLFPGYQSTMASAPEPEPEPEPQVANDSASSSNAEAAQQQAAADAQAEADALAAATDRQRVRDAEAAAQRERDTAAAAEKARAVEAERVAHERERDEAKAKLLADQDARNKASTDTDANTCVSSPTLKENATFQGNTGASVINGCGQPVDVRICLMTTDHGWNCGMTNGLASQGSWSWSSFHATGQVFMDARVSGSGKQLNSP